jgi:transposase
MGSYSKVRGVEDILSGKLSYSEVSERLRVDRSTVIRLVRKYRLDGLKGLEHGLKDKPSNNKNNNPDKDKIVKLMRDKYANFSISFACEMLLENEGIVVASACIALWTWCKKYGIPKTIYTDFRNAYLDKETGNLSRGMFGQMCERLGILVIGASKPQSKGRVERSNRTLKDRLIPWLALNKIDTLKAANIALPKYLKLHNRKLSIPKETVPDVHRSLPDNTQLKDYCYLESWAKLRNDWNVKSVHSPRVNKVLVHEFIDKSLAIFYNKKQHLFDP